MAMTKPKSSQIEHRGESVQKIIDDITQEDGVLTADPSWTNVPKLKGVNANKQAKALADQAQWLKDRVSVKGEQWIVCSDTQPITQLHYDNMGAMFRHMSLTTPNASIGVLNGDLVDRPTRDTTGAVFEFGYEKFLESLALNSHIPKDRWLFLAGNHDRDGTGAGQWEDAWTLKSYRKYFGREFYYTTRGNMATIHISDMGGQNSGEVHEFVCDWLDSTLKQLGGYNVILNMHQCIYGVQTTAWDNLQIQSARIQAAIERHDNIAAVLWGHNSNSTGYYEKHGTVFINTNLEGRDTLDTWKYLVLDLNNGAEVITGQRWNVGSDSIYETLTFPVKYPIKLDGTFSHDGRNTVDYEHGVIRDKLVVYRSVSERRVLDGGTWRPRGGVEYVADFIATDEANDAVSAARGDGVGIRFGVQGATGQSHGGEYQDYLSPAYKIGAAIAAVRLESDQLNPRSKLSFNATLPSEALAEVFHYKFDTGAGGSGAGSGLFVTSGGAITTGVGINSVPGYGEYSKEYVAWFANGTGRIYRAESTTNIVTISKAWSGSTHAIRFNSMGNTVGSINITDTATAYNTTSDATLKIDMGLSSVVEAVNRIKQIAIHDFKWKADLSDDRGVFAQELHQTHPNAVTEGGEEIIEEEVHYKPWAADYSKLVPDLVLALQAALQRIEQLESK